MKETIEITPIYKFPAEDLKKPDGEINEMYYRGHLLEFATTHKMPVRECFKQFAKEHFIDSNNITPYELFHFAYRLSSQGRMQQGLLLFVYALNITEDNASELIPRLLPDFSKHDMGAMGAFWEMEDVLGWPRGTTYPDVKTWG